MSHIAKSLSLLPSFFLLRDTLLGDTNLANSPPSRGDAHQTPPIMSEFIDWITKFSKGNDEESTKDSEPQSLSGQFLSQQPCYAIGTD